MAGTDQCQFLLQSFQELCELLRVLLAYAKTEGPSSVLTLLGIELDPVAACSRLPLDKLERLAELLEACIQAEKLSLIELQVLVGHLNFACRVVALG